MSLIEFIGFIITICALFFLVIKRKWEERRKREHPEEEHRKELQQKAHLKRYLKSLDLDVEEEEENDKVLPSHLSSFQPSYPKKKDPLPLKISQPQLTPYINPKVRNLAEGYHAIVKVKSSRGHGLVKRLPSKQEMIIYQEIMNPPLGFRPSNFR
jgi:hypothetical protein